MSLWVLHLLYTLVLCCTFCPLVIILNNIYMEDCWHQMPECISAKISFWYKLHSIMSTCHLGYSGLVAISVVLLCAVCHSCDIGLLSREIKAATLPIWPPQYKKLHLPLLQTALLPGSLVVISGAGLTVSCCYIRNSVLSEGFVLTSIYQVIYISDIKNIPIDVWLSKNRNYHANIYRNY